MECARGHSISLLPSSGTRLTLLLHADKVSLWKVSINEMHQEEQKKARWRRRTQEIRLFLTGLQKLKSSHRVTASPPNTFLLTLLYVSGKCLQRVFPNSKQLIHAM
ncbi:uncharacterized protein LOC144030764 isoform X1 [Festucalex cinctus]